MLADGSRIVGKLGADLTTAQGYEAARWCALNLLARMKVELGSNSTTILVRQGKYALDNSTTFTPQPDVIVDDIGGIQQLGYKELVGR